MSVLLRPLAAAALAIAVAASASPAFAAGTSDVTPKGRWLLQQLESMDVQGRWIAGAKVDWRTGEPTGEPEHTDGGHTHCSAFVASAAGKLGVYILRPPQHKQDWLANAQNEWLASDGRGAGWVSLASSEQAQQAANLGELVVASYHNHRDDKPGHIAIVRPGEKSAAALAEEGPDVIQAATVNSVSISLKAGFAGHVHAWKDQEIRFYAHAIDATAVSEAASQQP